MSTSCAASSSRVNAVYYPSWHIYRGSPPSKLPDKITHVYYAFVRVNVDGTLRHLDDYADFSIRADGETGCLHAFAKLKRSRPGLKTIISLGGGSGCAEFPAMAADPMARRMLASRCRLLLDQYGFDGIDVDWEHPTSAAEGRSYVELLRELRRALPPPFLLTTALPTGQYCLKHIDMVEAARLLDFLNLMGYDFTGPWTDVSGHQAQLMPPPGLHVYPTLRSSCHGGVDYILSRAFPAAKIILGIPVYARSFRGAHGPGQPFKDAAEMDYCDIPAGWLRAAKVDLDVATASFVDHAGKGFVSFDNPDTVRRKAEYVNRHGLGGLFYWTGLGDLPGPLSLVEAGYHTLNA